MSTSPAPAMPTNATGTGVVEFFKKLEVDVEDIGVKIESVFSGLSKDLPSVEAEINSALAVAMPKTVLPAETVEKIANAAVGALGSVGSALESGGLSATADQAAVVAVTAVTSAYKVATTKTTAPTTT